MSMWSATTSSLGSFIKSLGRWVWTWSFSSWQLIHHSHLVSLPFRLSCFSRRRPQRRSCLATWRKVPPLSSSWSSWATRSSSTTLKGSNDFFFSLQQFASCFSRAVRHSVSMRFIKGWIPEKSRFREAWHLCRDGVGSRGALGVLSVMDERELTGRSQWLRTLAFRSWCHFVRPCGCVAVFFFFSGCRLFSPLFPLHFSTSLEPQFYPFPSPFQIPRGPGCHSWPDGDRVRLHQFS